MIKLQTFLKLISPGFILVGLGHLLMGPNADVMLGASIPVDVISDPVLDSQNRFYGVVFALYGALFYICAQDLSKYETILRCTLYFFFVGGLARIVSIYVVGTPPDLVVVLIATELMLPPLLLTWLRHTLKNQVN